MSYVVSTASKAPFAKPKKHSQWESFPPVVQLLFPFDNSLYFVMVKYIQLACEQALWRALFLSPPPQSPPPPPPPGEIAGFRIPLAESRVPSPTPRAPRRTSGIPDSFSWIPGPVPRPQRACSQTNIQPRLLFKSPWEKFQELQEESVLYLFHIWAWGNSIESSAEYWWSS